MFKLFGNYRVCRAPEGDASGGGGESGSGTNENNNAQGNTGEGSSAPDLADILERVAKLELENQRLVNDKQRSLDDIKKAKEKTKALEEEQRKLNDKKARDDGNIQALLEQKEIALKESETTLQGFQRKWASEKSGQEALNIARKLTDPSRPNDAELLAELIQNRISYDLETNQPKVLNERGEETYATLDDLAKEIDTNRRFASLLKSSQRSGGGANGARGGASGGKQMTRDVYEALPPMEKAKRMQADSGWTIVD